MATIREQKEQVVSEIKELIDNSKSLVVVNYQGINTDEDTQLRKILRENGVQYKVLKNTMVDLAMEGKETEGFVELLDGPNAFAFGADETTAAKLIKKFITDKKKLEIKGDTSADTFIQPKKLSHWQTCLQRKSSLQSCWVQ